MSAELRPFIITVLCLFMFSESNAVTGARPPFASFEPGIEVYPQNFAIAEDQLGNIYIGNTEGVLSFDGKRWILTPLPNGDIVRSLDVGEQGMVYVGGYNAFGYIKPDATGQLTFTDLTQRFTKELAGEPFADIWNIAVTDDGVFFKGLQHLFFWSPETGKTKFWTWQGRFGAIHYYQNTVYLQFRGEGFRQYNNGNWEPIPGTEFLSELVTELVELPQGGLLTLSRNGEWAKLSDNGATPYTMPEALPPSSKLTDGILLDQQTLVFSGDQGQIYFFDTEAKTIEKFAVGQGFLSNLVKSSQGGLLTVDDSAVHHVPWPADWKLMDDINGLVGSVFAIRQIDGAIYALTGSGVFRKPANEPQFVRLSWSEHEAWDLLALENDNMILADSYRLSLIEGDKIRFVSEETIYPRILKRSGYNPDLIYVGTELGIGLLQKQQGKWQLVYLDSDMKNLRVTSIVETAENKILIGSERGGVQEIEFILDEQWRSTATLINTAKGLEYGSSPETGVVQTSDGKVFVATSAGFFQQKGDRFDPAMPGLNALRGTGEVIHLQSGPKGGLWGYTYKSLFKRQGDGAWQPIQIGNVRRGSINTIYQTEAAAVFVGANASIMLHDPRLASHTVTPRTVVLKSVELRQASGNPTRLPLNGDLKIDQAPSISFRYALPDLINLDKVRYRARLLPIEPKFSTWSSNAENTYYGLDPESYTFEVEASDGLGRISKLKPYRITVSPYWYQRPDIKALGLLLLFVLAGLIMLAAVRARSRILAAENQRLESMVSERTRELASANRQLESLAHLDSLTSIPNRRRLDAYLEEVWQQCIERDRTLALAMLDVDNFKQYNDEHGHQAGDELLKQLAQLLSHSLRRGEDLVARYGGEEFLVVLPGADVAAALEVAESMRSNVEKSKLAVTVSLGVATNHTHQITTIEALIKASDEALYAAKHGGRNRVIAHNPEQ